MKKTVTVQIGNSDNRLTQSQWADFCNMVHSQITIFGGVIHFSAPSVGWADWQNAVWVFELEEEYLQLLSLSIVDIRKSNKQDSVAWTEGITEFI